MHYRIKMVHPSGACAKEPIHGTGEPSCHDHLDAHGVRADEKAWATHEWRKPAVVKAGGTFPLYSTTHRLPVILDVSHHGPVCDPCEHAHSMRCPLTLKKEDDHAA